MIKLFLFDVEGTTTDINFVHNTLFPYSASRMKEYLHSHQTEPAVLSIMEKVKETVKLEDNNQLQPSEVADRLLLWIKEDRKHPALKEIQGLIWEEGYKNAHFKGHVYPDVKAAFMRASVNTKVGIYSSGSVKAQQLIFTHSEAGDLTPFISFYFDTRVGAKREKSSYERIAKETTLLPEEIHFFSDVPQELEAAEAAGFRVSHVVRGQGPRSRFEWLMNFEKISA